MKANEAENRGRGFTPAQRRHTRRVIYAGIAYAVLLIPAVYLVGMGLVGQPWLTLLAIAPAIPLVGMFASYGRYLSEETDEYQHAGGPAQPYRDHCGDVLRGHLGIPERTGRNETHRQLLDRGHLAVRAGRRGLFGMASRWARGPVMKNQLKVLRAMRDWSQQDLADRLAVSRQSVNAIETGKYDPSLPLAFRISEVFELPIEEIFQRD